MEQIELEKQEQAPLLSQQVLLALTEDEIGIAFKGLGDSMRLMSTRDTTLRAVNLARTVAHSSRLYVLSTGRPSRVALLLTWCKTRHGEWRRRDSLSLARERQPQLLPLLGARKW